MNGIEGVNRLLKSGHQNYIFRSTNFEKTPPTAQAVYLKYSSPKSF